MKLTAVLSLIIANVVVFVLQSMSNGAMDVLFALWPIQAIDGQSYFHVWQIAAHMRSLHSTDNILHLLFNMFGLWMFGTEIERHVGPRRLLAVSISSVITAALTQLFVPTRFGAPPGPTIGASGGVFGLILAYAVMFPRRKVAVYFHSDADLAVRDAPPPSNCFRAVYRQSIPGVALPHFAHLHGRQRLGPCPVAAASRSPVSQC